MRGRSSRKTAPPATRASPESKRGGYKKHSKCSYCLLKLYSSRATPVVECIAPISYVNR